VGLNALIPWGDPPVGIALTDGVGEIDVASTFEVYSASYAARAIPVATSAAVTTKHGMLLLANTPQDAPTLTLMVVPGAGGASSLDPRLREWSERHNVPVEAVQVADSRPAFDAALEYLSAQTGRATAVSAAKMIDYPVGQLRLADHRGHAFPSCSHSASVWPRAPPPHRSSHVGCESRDGISSRYPWPGMPTPARQKTEARHPRLRPLPGRRTP